MPTAVRSSIWALRETSLKHSWLITALISLLIYLATAARDLTWENFGWDGGELITASVTLGVPHPSGYPTYLLIGKLMSLLPLGTFAFRYTLLSVLSMTLAAAMVTRITRWRISSRLPSNDSSTAIVAIAAGLLFAFTPLVWSQAIIAEVYALNLAFVAALLWTLQDTRNESRAVTAGILLGLAITTHVTSLLLGIIALNELERRHWLKLTVGTAVGLSPFLLLPILSAGDSPVIWGQATSIDGWMWLVTARIYQSNIFAVAPFRWEIGSWVQYLGQFMIVSIALFLLTIQGAFSIPPPNRLLQLFVGAVFTIYALSYTSEDAIIFILPGLLLFIINMDIALLKLGHICLLLPIILVALNFGARDLRNDTSLRNLTIESLRTVPQRAVLVTPGDATISAMYYFRYAEQMRSDTIVVDSNMFQFDWYRRRLGQYNPGLTHLEYDDLSKFILANQQFRPVCYFSLTSPAENSCSEAKH